MGSIVVQMLGQGYADGRGGVRSGGLFCCLKQNGKCCLVAAVPASLPALLPPRLVEKQSLYLHQFA